MEEGGACRGSQTPPPLPSSLRSPQLDASLQMGEGKREMSQQPTATGRSRTKVRLGNRQQEMVTACGSSNGLRTPCRSAAFWPLITFVTRVEKRGKCHGKEGRWRDPSTRTALTDTIRLPLLLFSAIVVGVKPWMEVMWRYKRHGVSSRCKRWRKTLLLTLTSTLALKSYTFLMKEH